VQRIRLIIQEDIDPRIDQITSFSSRGPVQWVDPNGVTQTLQKPDIVAPGAVICAARFKGIQGRQLCVDDKHVLISGTSMAAPMVSGAAALVREAHPDWTPQQVKDYLKSIALDLGYPEHVQGAGRLDLSSLGLSQSRLHNLGGAVTGNLILRFEKLESDGWVIQKKVFEGSVNVAAGGSVALDQYWNGQGIKASEKGKYRVIAIYDPDNGADVMGSFEFEVV